MAYRHVLPYEYNWMAHTRMGYMTCPIWHMAWMTPYVYRAAQYAYGKPIQVYSYGPSHMHAGNYIQL